MVLDTKSMSRISIHALRKESDDVALPYTPRDHIFQSTLSVRRATRGLIRPRCREGDFNPRSP